MPASLTVKHACYKVTDSNNNHVCRYCGASGSENYCSNCGQPYQTKRITLNGLLHEVLHLFTHLDKGFGYTIKRLVITPGLMQREYIEGIRSRYQKPFSMFFICATIAALCRYWIFKALLKYYDTGNLSEVKFLNEYMVLLHIALLPVYVLIAYLFFYRSKYNYAEIGILLLYTISIFLLATPFISLLKFIWPNLDTVYVELPILLFYNAMTFRNFFNDHPRWKVVMKSCLIITIIFALIQPVEDFVIQLIS